MKKDLSGWRKKLIRDTILGSLLICISLAGSAQKKDKSIVAGEIGLNMSKDSVVQIIITRDEISNLIKAIDGNIDSKKSSKDIIDFLLSHAALVPKKEK